ncbi:YhgE/Pip domain-containing protein [Metabacillus litoralis]|uniref:YhgE/Pip domain-containing protein n=1 Tax=Metabacillus litoralis TaxID=152268 RepID=UPI001CFE2A24|nr:YhgE/Pip domain-containing protein [Metabacillus litoralis]
MKKILILFVISIIMMPSFLVKAESDNKTAEEVSSEKGEFSSKDEVVYANLSATGEKQEIYVVNILDIEKAGKIIDYGPYSSLKNLTNLSSLNQDNHSVEFSAPEGKFYYQGNMNEKNPLPWDITISYLMDGKEITPKEILGKEGHIQIKIATSANNEVDPIFFENYLLQISLSLNTDQYSNIKAPDGMLANAGKNKQVTFTVMPGKEEELVLEADVINFELEGINISAIPSSMSIDAPDIDDMTGDMQTLTDAIKEVNDGVAKLETGVSELNNGVKSLQSGSKEYSDGMNALNDSSSELINGSKNIQQALEAMNGSLANNSEQIDLADFKKLEDGLKQMSAVLKETSKSLMTLKENYEAALSSLDKAINSIPDYVITEEQTQNLYNSGADPKVLDQLLETYSASITAKETYAASKKAFTSVNATLPQVSGTLTAMASNLDNMTKELSTSLEQMNIDDSLAKLQEGINGLASNYKNFHKGLVNYTEGASQLTSSYNSLHNGINELSQGTSDLENGVSQLHDGTTELYESTSDLPATMNKEVDKMMSEFDKSDFDAVSFTSPKNEKINSVQFVFKTESIKQEEEEPKVTEKPEEEKGFWTRFMELFS